MKAENMWYKKLIPILNKLNKRGTYQQSATEFSVVLVTYIYANENINPQGPTNLSFLSFLHILTREP